MRAMRSAASIVRRGGGQLTLAGCTLFFVTFFSPALAGDRVLAPIDGVPAGRHRLRFRFRPRSFPTVGATSAIAVLALLIVAAMQAGARRVSSNLGAL